jgi:hypothetical protein
MLARMQARIGGMFRVQLQAFLRCCAVDVAVFLDEGMVNPYRAGGARFVFQTGEGFASGIQQHDGGNAIGGGQGFQNILEGGGHAVGFLRGTCCRDQSADASTGACRIVALLVDSALNALWCICPLAGLRPVMKIDMMINIINGLCFLARHLLYVQ